MNLFSIKRLLTHAHNSLKRFPLSLLSACIAVTLGIYLIEYEHDISNIFPYLNTLLVTALGIPLFFCTAILTEKQSTKTKIVIHTIALFSLLALYFSFPNNSTTHNTSLPYIRYTIFSIIVHLLVSFIPYSKNKKMNGFWNYNKTLFLRFSASILYSGFLYVGLILALSALKILFEFDIHDELYFELFIFILGIFNTWFFLSGIPKELEHLETERNHPKNLKLFTQYVLLPLLALYLSILYIYGFKIILNWDWPKGIVSYLISCVSILGTLTALLLHPYGNSKENQWIPKFIRFYYYSLFPLVLILGIAIWIRINDYGITINRYIIVVLGLWITLISSYFSFKSNNIKFIPISLTIILLLISFGPWSMFSVSERSQIQRLTSLLKKNDILKKGTIQKEVFWNTDSLPRFVSQDKESNEGLLNDSTHNEVKSILEYLDDHHGFTKIHGFFQQNMDSLVLVTVDSNARVNEARIYMQTLGLTYQHKSRHSKYYQYSSPNPNFISVRDYDYVIELHHNRPYRKKKTQNKSKQDMRIDTTDYTFAFDLKEAKTMTMTEQGQTTVFALDSIIESLHEKYLQKNKSSIPKEHMTLWLNTEKFQSKLEIKSIGFDKEKTTTSIESIQAKLFLKQNTH